MQRDEEQDEETAGNDRQRSLIALEEL